MYLVIRWTPLTNQFIPFDFGSGAKPVQKVTPCIGLPLEPRNKYYELPFDVSPDFTGGNEVCRKLHENCLASEHSAARVSQRIFTLYGLGGSGKTQMALKFASDHRERYKSTFTLFCLRRTSRDFADP